MNLRTYQAYSMAEALTEIRHDLGDDAVILHTRSFKRGGILGLLAKTVIEVTAATADDVAAARKKRHRDRKRREVGTSSESEQKTTKARRSRSATRSITDQVSLTSTQSRVVSDSNRRAAPSQPVAATSTGQNKTGRAPAAPKATAPVPELPARARRSSKVEQSSSEAGTNTSATKRNMAPDQPAEAPHPVAQRFVIKSPEATNDPPAKSTQVSRIVANRQRLVRPPSKPAPQTAPAPSPTPAPSSPPPSPPSRPAAEAPSARQNVATTAKPVAKKMETSDQDLQGEIGALRQMVSQVLQRQSGSTQLAMPEELFKQYLALIENEVASELADEICGQVRDTLTANELANADIVAAAVRKHVANLIPVAGDSMTLTRTLDGRPLTIALVGPTGVGKTTTVAKLAAAFKLQHGRRVGLITTDTYRIAAVDQLRTYANIIGVPLKVALTETEMASACHELRDCDVILIDTAGRSPNDTARLDEIRSFIDTADPHEVHLVLASTASQTVLLRTIEQFSSVRTDRMIFTKLDEAVSFGVLINVMRRVDKRLSFVTMGQEVPEQFEPGQPERLAKLVLGEKMSS